MNVPIRKSNFQISQMNQDQFFSIPLQRRLSRHCSLVCCETLWSSGMEHHIMQYSSKVRIFQKNLLCLSTQVKGAVCFCEILVAIYLIHGVCIPEDSLCETSNLTCYVVVPMKSFKNTQLQPQTLYLPKNICLCPGMCNISEFLRHMAYLGFIFSLTFTCYCAGLCVAWRQRHCFQTHNSAL